MSITIKAGKSVGIVTNTYLTHASPSAAYAKEGDYGPCRLCQSVRQQVMSEDLVHRSLEVA